MNREAKYVTPNRRRGNFFNILEQKVIVQIFSYLKSHQRQLLREVCFSWKSIIDEHFGFRLKNWKCYQPRESLMVFEIRGPVDSSLHLLLPIFLHNCNLRTLIIDLRPLPKKKGCENPLNQSCSDVSLTKHHCKNNKYLAEKTLVLLEQRVWLPRLEKCRIICSSTRTPPDHHLGIDDNSSSDAEVEDWQQIQLIYLLFHLLRTSPVEELEFFADHTKWELPLEIIFGITIPRVNIYSQDVDVKCHPTAEHGYGYGCGPILKIVPVHLLLETLKYLKFRNDYEVSLHFLVGRKNHYKRGGAGGNNIVSRRFTSEYDHRIVPNHILNTNSCLDSLAFRIGSGKKWLSKGWCRILRAQSHLRELDYEFHRGDEMRKSVNSILSNNHATLRILKLYGTRQACYSMDSFDGSWFRGLINLEELELVGESSEEKIYLKNLLPMLIRPWNLPPSLKCLVVHGPIDCTGKVSPGVALKNLTSLRKLEMLGRFQSSWFHSEWNPVFEIDSNFIQNFHQFLPSLRVWKLIYLKPKIYGAYGNQAFLKLDKTSWSNSYIYYTIQTRRMDCKKEDVISSTINIQNDYLHPYW